MTIYSTIFNHRKTFCQSVSYRWNLTSTLLCLMKNICALNARTCSPRSNRRVHILLLHLRAIFAWAHSPPFSIQLSATVHDLLRNNTNEHGIIAKYGMFTQLNSSHICDCAQLSCGSATQTNKQSSRIPIVTPKPKNHSIKTAAHERDDDRDRMQQFQLNFVRLHNIRCYCCLFFMFFFYTFSFILFIRWFCRVNHFFGQTEIPFPQCIRTRRNRQFELA